MKNRILILLVALIATLSLSAQTIRVYKNSETAPVALYVNGNGTTYQLKAQGGNTLSVYKNGETTPTATFTNSEGTKYRVVTNNPASDQNLLKGKFSVAANKQVQFTKGNLFWNGSVSQYHLEAKQTDVGTYDATKNAYIFDANHVCLFFWTSWTDYCTGTAAYMPYAESYGYSSRSNHDEFFCSEAHPLSVDGTPGLYVLSRPEWNYLLNSRANASNLRKTGVAINNGTATHYINLVIAPDNYKGTIASSYSAAEWAAAEAEGLVCLPAAGWRRYTEINQCNKPNDSQFGNGNYCTSTTENYQSYKYLQVTASAINLYGLDRTRASAIRLVKTAE